VRTPRNKEANRAVAFINNLTCTGDFDGKPLKLRPWQEKVVRQIFGARRKDGTRQYHTCFLFIPRKQGKSSLVAACALAELFSGKAGQQILIVAGDKTQAGVTFEMMEAMLNHKSAATLRDLVEINKTEKRIVYAAKNSFVKAMSSEAGTKLGFNPSTVIFDEFLVQQNRDLWSTISSGGGARKDWFTFIISTAGDDRASPVYDEFVRAKKIAADPSVDPTYLPVLYYATEEEASGDKWQDEKLWHRVNPALDDFANLEYLRVKCLAAKDLPYEERIFRQRYLNQFVDASDACWIPADAWAKCRADDLPDLHQFPSWAAVDLSKVNDLTACSFVFTLPDDTYAIKSYAWIPHYTLRKHENKDHANYFQWVREGWLKTCPGEVIDYHFLRDELLDLFRLWKPKQVLWDRYGADYLIQGLQSAGVPMLEFGQGTQSMSQPTKEFERLVLSRKLLHDGNPALAWCVGNVALEVSGTELVKPHKGRSTGRIDMAIAGIMALAAAMNGARKAPSVYEDREFLMSLLPGYRPPAETIGFAATR
jgi:phage terminase large subunit-like protein